MELENSTSQTRPYPWTRGEILHTIHAFQDHEIKMLRDSQDHLKWIRKQKASQQDRPGWFARILRFFSDPFDNEMDGHLDEWERETLQDVKKHQARCDQWLLIDEQLPIEKLRQYVVDMHLQLLKDIKQ